MTLLSEMTFGESLMQPVWEDPMRFASPAYIGGFMAIWALWKGSKEVADFIAAARKVWPLVVEILNKFKDVPHAPQPVQQAAPESPAIPKETAEEIARLRAELALAQAKAKEQPKVNTPASQ